MKRTLIIAALISFAFPAAAQDPTQGTAQNRAGTPGGRGTAPGRTATATAAPRIDPENLRAHVQFLSHDLLEGRGTGSRGEQIAAEYIATMLRLADVKPAGDNGTYFQKVGLVGITSVPEGTTMAYIPQGGQPVQLKYRDQFVTNNATGTQRETVESPIIYLGYGISAPEYGWDDYKDTDVRGKVLLMHVNEPQSNDPKSFKGPALTYYGRWTYKYEEAARRGAAGVLLIHQTDMASYGWDVVRNSNTGERSYLAADKNPRLRAASWVQWDVAQAILKAGGQDLDALLKQAGTKDFNPVPLNVTARIQVQSSIRPFESNNVIGWVDGSDPKLRNEAVLYSAHYDHLGTRPGQQGDNIYNGAVDNASGSALLIEMARAVASMPRKPRRSMYFAWVTAEEQGLWGSAYLGQNPPIPARNITLNLNFDGLLMVGVPEEIQVTGAERTTFYPTVERTAKQFGFRIVPDTNPGAGYYYRSDHFSMARVGVPAFSVDMGDRFKGRDEAWGKQQESEYRAKHYHQPSDQYVPGMDFTGLAELGRFGLSLGFAAAQQGQKIGWQPGDEFEGARTKSLAAQ